MVYYNAFDEDGQHAACEPAVTDHVIRNIEKPKAAVLMVEGIVPGGRTAGAKLIANESVTRMLQYFDENNKLIAGMCSGTTVLHAAGVLAKKTVTGYTGYADKLVGANFVEDVAVFDRNVITSQGPATPYPFAFKIMEACAIELQVDLSDYGKRVRTAISYSDQIHSIISCDKEDLVIIFSYTGAYFDYVDFAPYCERLAKPKIWMIYSDLGDVPSFVDRTIYFSSKHEKVGHPFCLEAIERLIVMKYELLYGFENFDSLLLWKKV